jgi:hypothetical protein
MKRQGARYLKIMLTIVFAMGMVLSSNARTVTHDLTELAQIVAHHHAETRDHGHAHEDIVDVLHAYHGHAHDVADHDHNIAFLPPRSHLGIAAQPRSSWALSGHAMPGRTDFGLDRPPRV